MTGWTRLTGSPGDRLVLAVDFDATGRAGGTFRDLARHLPPGHEVWQTLPPPDGHDHLAWWLDTLPGTEVGTVLGYCAGGVFACALADRFPTRPAVVLLDPGPPTVSTLDRDFRASLDALTGLTDDERADLHAQVTRARHQHGDDFTAVSSDMARVHRSASAQAFERLGVDPDIAEELTGLFGGYLAYLVAARALPWRPGPTDRSCVSRDHNGPVTADAVLFDLPRADLLRSPLVAAALFRPDPVAAGSVADQEVA